MPDTLFHYTVTVFDPDRENTIFVSKCSGNTPCPQNIQGGIALAFAPATFEITEETYHEDINLNLDEEVALRGGWDSGFASNPSYTTTQGSITISKGTLRVENVIVK